MANLSITATCNRDCDYCFAMETLDNIANNTDIMSMSSYEKALRFALHSDMKELRLLGGEPTTHPQFNVFLDKAIVHQLSIMVFSGGLIPKQALRKIESLDHHMIKVLVNVIPPGEGNPVERRRQKEIFRQLGSKIILGLNIYSPAVQLDFLMDWIERYELSKIIRLGLAHPILEGNNEYLHPRHYPEVGKRVAAFMWKAAKKDIEVEFDCGWVPCMFPEGSMEVLGITPQEVGLRCSPIIDILPNNKAISCFPLAKHHQIELSKKSTRQSLHLEFESQQKNDREVMLYPKCMNCNWRKEEKCTGGCLSASMRRLRRTDFSFQYQKSIKILPKTTDKDSTMIPLPVINARISHQ